MLERWRRWLWWVMYVGTAMAERKIVFGEDLHTFKRVGKEKFRHLARPRYAKSVAQDRPVNGLMSEAEVTDWINVHKNLAGISLEDEREAMAALDEQLGQDPLHLITPRKK